MELYDLDIVAIKKRIEELTNLIENQEVYWTCCASFPICCCIPSKYYSTNCSAAVHELLVIGGIKTSTFL